MKSVELGHTGVHVSAIGFGGMPLSIQGRPPEPQARQTLHAALDAGMTLIDTADVYCLDDNDIGHNERLIASVLRERGDDGAIVATKGGLRRPKGEWTRDASPAHLREACERSLRALGVEQIFLYQLHAPDPRVTFERSVETLAQLREQRKIRHVGLSNVSVAQIRSATEIVEIQSVQNRLNPWHRDSVTDGVVEECARRKITFLAYSPLGGKRLSQKVGNYLVLKELAQKHGVSPHVIVIAWVRAQGETVVPIPAASRPENARSSAAAADVMLTRDDLATIDATEFRK